MSPARSILNESRLVVDVARPEDDPAIRALHRQPMAGAVSVALEREPDHGRAAGIEGERRIDVVVRDVDTDAVCGCGFRAVRPLWMNGRVERVGYLGALRTRTGVRARRRILAEGFAATMQDRRADEYPADVTSIMADNRVARRLLERAVPGMPTYTPIGALATLTFRARPRGADGVRSATARDLPGIIAGLDRHGPSFHARPAWTDDDLRSAIRTRGLAPEDFLVLDAPDGSVRGCVAVWDQRGFKQTRVHGYGARLERWRRPISLALRLAGRPDLPPPGTVLPLVFASHLAIDLDDDAAVATLLRAAGAVAARKGASLVAVGLPAAHSVTRVMRRTLRAWTERSIIYLVHDGSAPPLDPRPVWPEVAVL